MTPLAGPTSASAISDLCASWSTARKSLCALQFKTKHGSYHTIKTVRTGEYGFAQTTVTAKKSGTFRYIFAGNSTATSASAAGDHVKVVKG